MPFLLRKVKKYHWVSEGGPAWLPEGELQADALTDLPTKGNRLSVWYIDDERSNFEQLVAALAANCDFISNIDCVLIRQELVNNISVTIEATSEGTKDMEANMWHRDLTQLSVTKLVALARVMQSSGVVQRVQKRDVLTYLARAIVAGRIDRSSLENIQSTKDLAKLDQTIAALQAR